MMLTSLMLLCFPIADHAITDAAPPRRYEGHYAALLEDVCCCWNRACLHVCATIKRS